MLRRFVLASLLVACGGATPAALTSLPGESTKVAASSRDGGALPQDPALVKGVLPNGLTYYILPNKRPEKRAQLWLAVNAGSLVEDDDQRGLAHFVEHMCFNGTKRFPKDSIIAFVERSGIKFGADINAYTNFDETVYKLQVPTDKPELVATGIQVLRDFADGATFDPNEVEKERGVVLEEWRLRRGPSARHADKVEAETQHPSRYTTHHPIGKPEIIKGAPVATVERFYHDWYRPDLMAVIAVGDFTAADIEAKVKTEFASMQNPKSERQKPPTQIRFADKPTISIDSDPEQSDGRVELANRFPHETVATEQDLRRSLTEQLWAAMFGARLDELARSNDPPFASGRSTRTRPLRPVDEFRQSVLVKDDAFDEALAALYREALRIDRNGFTKAEIERSKANLLRAEQRKAAEGNYRDSKDLVGLMLRNFFTGEAVPRPDAENELAKRLIPTIEIADVNRIGATFGKTRHISISGPDSLPKPNEAAVKSTIGNVKNSVIPPYEDSGGDQQLMAGLPTPGKIVGVDTVPDLGVVEWKLSNGARVILKATTNGDTVRMSAFSPGGSSLVSDADYDSARYAGAIMVESGWGPLDVTKLRRALAGKSVRLDIGISELQETVTGQAGEEDSESLFQLVHLAFTAPRRDENAFATWKNAMVAHFKNVSQSPELEFSEQMSMFQTQNNLRRRPPDLESVGRVSLDRTMAIYRDRFADASGFTFIFVGNIDLQRFKGFTETYLASLPSTNRHETWKDLGISFPNGVQTKTVTYGREPKSHVRIVFHGAETYSPVTSHDVSTLADVLGIRLRETLREDMSGTYGVKVTGGISRRPKQEYVITIDFGCAPENADKLVKATFDEIARMQREGVGDDYLNRVREIKKRTREVQVNDDGYWLKRLESLYTFNDDPKAAEAPPRTTSDRIRDTSKKYLDTKEYVLGVLKPR